jgi:hypothetical protein
VEATIPAAASALPSRRSFRFPFGSLFRSATHSVLATGRFGEAVNLTQDALALLEDEMHSPSVTMAFVYGALLLAGSMAAARAKDRSTAREFLSEAERFARRMGGDFNEL